MTLGLELKEIECDTLSCEFLLKAIVLWFEPIEYCKHWKTPRTRTFGKKQKMDTKTPGDDDVIMSYKLYDIICMINIKFLKGSRECNGHKPKNSADKSK